MIDKQPEFQASANIRWPAQHTWTPYCAGLHPPGPCPDPESLLITEVQRLTVGDGDSLVVRTNREYLDEAEAREIRERIRAYLQMPEHAPILVVPRDWEFTIVAGDHE